MKNSNDTIGNRTRELPTPIQCVEFKMQLIKGLKKKARDISRAGEQACGVEWRYHYCIDLLTKPPLYDNHTFKSDAIYLM
jgi:hypothetical protein